MNRTKFIKRGILVITFIISMLVRFNNVYALDVYTEVNNVDSLKTAIENGENVKITGNFEISESIKITNKNIKLDLNGFTITGKDNNEKGNFNLFEVFKSEVHIIDSKGNGIITLESKTDRDWNAMSNVIENHTSIVTIDGGTFKHLGGTDMAFSINVNANSYGDTTLNINGGTYHSTYTAIRLFMASAGTTYLNINDGNIDGVTSAIWAQAPESKAGQKGEIKINGGNIGTLNTARTDKAVVNTVISGGIVENIKTEKGELKINGGKIEGALTILEPSGETVNYDSIITAGIFLNDHKAYLDSSVKVTAQNLSGENTIYAVGEENIKNIVADAKKGDIITVDGNIELNEVSIGVTIKSTNGNTVTVNGIAVPETGLTIEAVSEIELTPIDPNEETGHVRVGVKETEKTEKVLKETMDNILKNQTDSKLMDIITNNDTKVQINVDIEEEKIDKNIKSQIKSKFKDLTITNFFDINVEIKDAKNENVLATVDKLSEEIELMIILPETIKNNSENIAREYFIIRRHLTEDDEEIEKINAVLSEDGKYLKFKTSKFSTYALAYADEKIVTTPNPQTNDKMNNAILLGTLSLIILVATMSQYSKRRAN